MSQWNSISSYEQAESKFGTTFHLLIKLNINIDIQLASSNSNLPQAIPTCLKQFQSYRILTNILTNSYLEGMKMLLTL